jgi:hypothetical protein
LRREMVFFPFLGNQWLNIMVNAQINIGCTVVTSVS